MEHVKSYYIFSATTQQMRALPNENKYLLIVFANKHLSNLLLYLEMKVLQFVSNTSFLLIVF